MTITDLLCEKGDRMIHFERYPNTWGGVLKCYMDFYGIKLNWFYTMEGVANDTIKRLLTDEGTPTLSTASKICRVLGIDLMDWVRHVPEEARVMD